MLALTLNFELKRLFIQKFGTADCQEHSGCSYMDVKAFTHPRKRKRTINNEESDDDAGFANNDAQGMLVGLMLITGFYWPQNAIARFDPL